MSSKPPVLLAIESSCDETAAAVMAGGQLLHQVVASQEIHQIYGGVVPELASRAHQAHVVPVVERTLVQSGYRTEQLDAVAFTQGPGLLGALLVGASFAKALAFAHGIPLIGVHHMKAHVLANFLEGTGPGFPFLCLAVSGGHTQLLIVHDYLAMEVIGQTRDDAAGEAFDKLGKHLGLPYPAGPLMDQYAQQGNPERFRFPATHVPGLDFSFSGIKTAVLYFLRDQVRQCPDFIAQNKADLCASIQATLVGMLCDKLVLAMEQTGLSQVALAGGVAANTGLRLRLEALVPVGQLYIPKPVYCTDNAAMVVQAAHHQYLAGDFCALNATPLPRMPLTTC